MLAMDLHSGQCVGYFDIPVDHVYGDSVILDYLASKRITTGDLVVVSPDVGGVARARAFAKKVGPGLEYLCDLKASSPSFMAVVPATVLRAWASLGVTPERVLQGPLTQVMLISGAWPGSCHEHAAGCVAEASKGAVARHACIAGGHASWQRAAWHAGAGLHPCQSQVAATKLLPSLLQQLLVVPCMPPIKFCF